VRDATENHLVAAYFFTGARSRRTMRLGWWLAAPARGRGLGRESLAAILDYGHDHLAISHIEMGTSGENHRSIAQIEAVGARLRRRGLHRLPDGQIVD